MKEKRDLEFKGMCSGGGGFIDEDDDDDRLVEESRKNETRLGSARLGLVRRQREVVQFRCFQGFAPSKWVRQRWMISTSLELLLVMCLLIYVLKYFLILFF